MKKEFAAKEKLKIVLSAPVPAFTQKFRSCRGYVVDGGKARIILAALVTPASIMDNPPMLDLARWVRFR